MACSTRESATSEQRWNTMKLFYTLIFLLSLASAAFAREEPVLHGDPVTGVAGGGLAKTQARGDDCASDIAPSIQNEFRTGVKLFSPMAPSLRSTLDRR